MKAARSLMVATALAVVAGGLTALPAAAADLNYVALGDSYSSGTGTRSYIDDGTACERSVYAYPSLLAAATGATLNFRACSGARTSDVLNNQVSALNADTDVVTLSVGGNDIGFVSVLTECAKPGWMSNCNRAIDNAQRQIRDDLPGRLAEVYRAIAGRAPYADVVVVGYPRLFMGEDCNAFTWFSPAEQSRLNSTADLLNSTIDTATTAYGFTYRSAIPSFVGHAVCDNPEWVNGLSSPISNSYHPNRLGHAEGYFPLVSSAVTGRTLTVTDAVLTTAKQNGAKVAREQQAHQAADAGIAPQRFTLPDLKSAKAKAIAAAVGVDLHNKASIDRFDAAYSYLQAASVGLGDLVSGGATAAKELGVQTRDAVVGVVSNVGQAAGAAGDKLARAGESAANTAKKWGAAAWDRLGG